MKETKMNICSHRDIFGRPEGGLMVGKGGVESDPETVRCRLERARALLALEQYSYLSREAFGVRSIPK